MNKCFFILVIILLSYINTTFAQNELYIGGKAIDISYDTITGNQTFYLNRSHNGCLKLNHFVVDYLQLDSTLFVLCKIQDDDCSSIKVIKNDFSIVIKTKLLIVLDGQLLSKPKEKKTVLSTIDKSRINTITKIDKEKAVSLYGKKGGNGALIIKSACASLHPPPAGKT